MLEKSIYKAISKYDNIVVARHVGPDPDADLHFLRKMFMQWD